MPDRPARVLVVGDTGLLPATGGSPGGLVVEPILAVDVAEARELLRVEEVDAVLATGLDLPELRGLVRSAGPVPVVALTAECDEAPHACLPPDAPPAAVGGALAGAVFRHRAQALSRLLEAATSLMDEALCAADDQGRIILANRAFDDLYGFGRGEAIGRHVRGLWEDEGEYDILRDRIRKRFRGTLEWDAVHRRADGTAFPVTLAVSLVTDARGRDAIVGVIRGMAAESRLDAALECLSGLDGLTGLPSRERFEAVLATEWRRARRQGLPLAVVMADLDGFSAFNDLYGTRAGDRCLAAVAREFRAFLKRAGNLAARWGGEEFTVLLPGADLRQAAATAEQMRLRVEALAVPHQGSPSACNLTASFGVAATVPTEAGRPGELVDLARASLEVARARGGNAVAARELLE